MTTEQTEAIGIMSDKEGTVAHCPREDEQHQQTQVFSVRNRRFDSGEGLNRDGSCYQKSRQNCQQIIGSYFPHPTVKNRQWRVFFISQVMERGCKIKFAGLIADKKWLSKT